ncbi:MAG: bile acid:sodium symporter family protein [Flavobacteriales bacterium]|nr:bile acid:sodium symporter family protein [Flavobacteriales bacterium]MCB9204651.1 bile acid:sodium symporter family protein [Flavobacteriales bacterium]
MEEAISINFDPNSRMTLNFLLAFIMFGVALDLRWQDISRAFRNPKPTLLGLLSQFVLMPALTFAVAYFWNPLPGLALGMFLVAACPGGTISNFMSSVAKADLGLSVTLTAVSTFLCLFFTPFNFEFWSGLYPHTSELLKTVSLDAKELFSTVFLFLILPVFVGMFFRSRFPVRTNKIMKPIRWLSMVIFIAFVVVAFLKNKDNFLAHAHLVLALVVVHNGLALILGYLVGKAGRLNEAASRSLSIETGIQNSGLGLVICFNFFPEIGEMALLCASWGIWHIISGLTLSTIWSRLGTD